MRAVFIAGSVALVLANQVVRAEPLWSEWWLDVPVAALLCGFAGLWWRSRARSEVDDLTVAVNGGSHVDDMLATLTEQACSIMGVERSMALLRDESDPRSSVLVAGHGIPADLIGARFGVDEGMAGQAMRTGKPLLVDDHTDHPRSLRHPVADGLRGGGAAPIRCGRHVLGALWVGTTHAGRRFGGAELETLCRLADLGAVALEQARVREELEQAANSGVEAMAAAIDMRDNYTGEHSEQVVHLASRVGERLGLTDKALSELEIAARLHDLGKIGVPDAVLLKDGPLEAAEWEVMRRHPEWGEQLLGRVPGLKRVSRIVRHAHERWDGGGYPDKLRLAEIPLESRIISACDAYEAMTSDRPYRTALRPWIAVSELREGAGGQFDPDVVDALVNELRRERSVSTSLFQEAERIPAGVSG